MTLSFARGNALDPAHHVVAHGCNTLGKFGAGFARQVRDLHPGSYDAYMAAFHEGRLKLGAVIRWDGEGRTILHCMTQPTYGRTGVHVDYEALRGCMRRIENLARRHLDAGSGVFHEWPRLVMPRIGSGLAGGDPAIVSDIVSSEIRSIDVVIFDRD
jgi:O-acetyl-ADP-ribose deacetylase (regulator of RNase III)